MKRSGNVVWLRPRRRRGPGAVEVIVAGGLFTGLVVAGQTLATLLSAG